MYIYYVDKRTIGLKPDEHGYSRVEYRVYDSSMTWENIKALYSEEELPFIVKVTDPEKMRQLADPDGKMEIEQRKYQLLSMIDFIYEQLTNNDGKLPTEIVDQYVPNHGYMGPMGVGYNSPEEHTYDLQYAEAKAFRDSNYTNLRACPNVANIASTANRDLNELVDKIIAKHEKNMLGGIKYLGYKQKNTKFIENQNDLSKVRSMYQNYDWIDFGPDVTKSDLNRFMSLHSDRFRYYDQFAQPEEQNIN